MLHKGERWERPATGPADLAVAGGDAELAAAVRARPGARVDFTPSATSDLARALGLGATGAATGALELPVDAVTVSLDGVTHFAVNMVVLGCPPDRLGALSGRVGAVVGVDGRPAYDGRAATVVVANGQFLRGADVVPRGHPGDGRLEVQVYAPTVAEARAMRDRLATGTHVPHPRIAQATGRRVTVELARPARVEVDGVDRGKASLVVVEVVPGACSILR